MPKVKDPVCGMMIDTDTAAARANISGRTYFFCTQECLQRFEANPSRYVRNTIRADSSTRAADTEFERHAPPYTKSGKVVAPKFGAAGSGGAEYERLPEAHRDEGKR